MKVHEYQAKELFRQHGVAVPEGAVASTPKRPPTGLKRWGTEPSSRRRSTPVEGARPAA